jgi:hypothetical protein
MARATLDAMQTRRQQVEALELRGATPTAIAQALAADIRTVRRDLVWLASERARRMDVPAARLRLLEAAQAVERTAWELHARLPADDANGRLGALAKVLGAHERQAALLGAIETATLAAEVAALRAQVAGLVAERPGMRLVGS